MCLPHSPDCWQNIISKPSAKPFLTSGDMLMFDVLIQFIEGLMAKTTSLYNCLHTIQIHSIRTEIICQVQEQERRKLMVAPE